MVDIHDIPPEILAAAFEMGIYSSGNEFIRPLALVCRSWLDIVNNTPRLWGIISIEKKASPKFLESRIAKAKASPLSLTVTAPVGSKRMARVVKELLALCDNWVSLDTGIEFISSTRWMDLYKTLEELTLATGNPKLTSDPCAFFDIPDPSSTNREAKLRSFTAVSLSKAWTLGFLSPSIRHLSIIRGYDKLDSGTNGIFPWRVRSNLKIGDTWDYLKRVPNAVSIELREVFHPDPLGQTTPVIHLSMLQKLQLTGVLHATSVLSAIAAPSLQTLSVGHQSPHIVYNFTSSSIPMTSFLSQWSQPGFVPTTLHTLELIDCLTTGDIPFFIRWLERLPNLVRLFLVDNNDVIGQAALKAPDSPLERDQTDLFKALASPKIEGDEKLGTWLCPSLMIFRFGPDAEIKDLISIARSRGGIAPYTFKNSGIPPPARLRRIESHLCFNAEQEEIDLLISLADHVHCTCLRCGFPA